MKTLGYFLNRTAEIQIYYCEFIEERYVKEDTGLWKRIFETQNGDVKACPVCGKFENHYTNLDGYEDYSCGNFQMFTNEQMCDKLLDYFKNGVYTVTFVP